MQGARVPSLVRELRSHTPDGISSVQSRMANHFSILVLPWEPHEQCERPSGTAKIKKKGLENWCIFLFPWSKFFSETRWINCLYMSLVGRINQDIWVRANIFFASFFLEGGSEKFFFFFFYNLFLVVLGLQCYEWAFSSCPEQEPLFIEVRGLLTAVACFVPEHSL